MEGVSSSVPSEPNESSEPTLPNKPNVPPEPSESNESGGPIKSHERRELDISSTSPEQPEPRSLNELHEPNAPYKPANQPAPEKARAQATPTIDVMLPYYGDVEFFKAAVSSVLHQTYAHWRLAIFDDGYPSDEPRAWVESLDDGRITYERNAENLGANGNYRKALAAVTAPYFIMMGADDIMQPHHLEHAATLTRIVPSVDVIQTGVAVIDENDHEYEPLPDRVKSWYAPHGADLHVLEGEQMATSLLRADWMYFPSIVWRTRTVQQYGFREGFDVVQDLALLLDIAAGGGVLVYDPPVSFSYRRHAGSDSSVRAFDGRRFDEERHFFELESTRFRELGWKHAAAAARRHISSRLNAGAQLPKALRAKSPAALMALGKHIIR